MERGSGPADSIMTSYFRGHLPQLTGNRDAALPFPSPLLKASLQFLKRGNLGLLRHRPSSSPLYTAQDEPNTYACLFSCTLAETSRLSAAQIKEGNRVLRAGPSDAGLRANLWDGKTLSAWIEKKYGIQLGVRPCQRLFRHFGFRLRKPRPRIARANPSLQKAHKKNSGS
jgi:hypothetical protein